MNTLTEEQARTKWCPHVVANLINPRAGFDGRKCTKVHPCIASECMAWRWGPAPFETIRNYREKPTIARLTGFKMYHVYPDDWYYLYSARDQHGEYDLLQRPMRDPERVGYCGFAGNSGE